MLASIPCSSRNCSNAPPAHSRSILLPAAGRPARYWPDVHRRHVAAAASTSSSNNGNGNGVVDTSAASLASTSSSNPYNWSFDSSKPAKPDPKVQDIPVAAIRRPLGRTRSNGGSCNQFTSVCVVALCCLLRWVCCCEQFMCLSLQ